MGAPMARNLLRAGHAVRLWNRSIEKAQALEADGARAAPTAVAAVSGAEVIVTMLADGDAVAEVMAVAAPEAPAGAVWWQASTVGIAANEHLEQLAAAHDLAFVDAPVLGTRKPAEDAALTVLASGPDDALARCETLFAAVGSRTLRLGPAGAGTRLKLVVNHWLLGLVETLAETVALAEGIDVDPEQFLDTIAGGPLDAAYAQTKGRAMIERAFDPSFALRLAAKDAELVLDAAARHDVDLALAPALLERFRRAIDAGHGDQDMAAALYGTLSPAASAPRP
jgi:3-hydroxyisobutyrate dehydrogenase